MNKRHLSAFRRSTTLRIACLLILAVMCAPAAMAAAITVTPAPTLASVSGFSPLFVAGGIGLAGLGLMNAAKDDGSENGGGEPKQEDKPVDPAAAIQQIEDRTLPMSQRLSVAANALRGIAPAEQFTKVKADLATAHSTIQAKDTEIVDLKAKLKTAEDQLAAAQTDVSTLEQANAKLEQANKDLAAKEQDLAKRASEQAKQIVRGIGMEAGKLPAAQTGDDAQPTAEDRIRELKGMKRTEAALHFKQHGKLPAWMN